MNCPRCGGTKRHRYVDPYGGVADVCDCGHPVESDPYVIHDLLNARPTPKPLANTCHSCGRKVLDAPVCSPCFGNVLRWLTSVVESLADELDVTIARQSRFADEGQRVTGTATPPLPLHVDASEARDDLRAKLVSWVKLLEEEMVR